MKNVMLISRRHIWLLLLLICTGRLLAQEKSISGKITDQSTGQPLPGVTVMVKGSNRHAITDNKGEFTLPAVSADNVLSFRCVGYLPQETPVGERTTFQLSLAQDTKALGEVVVVGYGTRRKSDLTGAISQVKPAEIQVVSSANAMQSLQGRAAGVSVSNNNQPGEQPVIRIRGSGSITAGNSPLIVVDGFPLVNSNLNDINANDIASIEILKDASATAIYGSRGANGVIMVTTKGGGYNQKKLTVSSYYGIQSPARLVKMMSRDQFLDFINAAYTNQTGRPVYTDQSPAPNYNTDWQDAIIKDHAPVQDYTVTFEGGNNDTRYLLSTGIFSQSGLQDQSGFKRYSVRTNLDHRFTKWLTAGTHLQVNRSIKDVNEGATDNIFRFGWPTMPVHNPDGSFYFAADDPQHAAYVEGRWNPVADANEKTERTSTNRILGDLYAELKLGKHLSFRTNVGADLSNAKDYYFATSRHSAGRNSNGDGRQGYVQEQTLINENILTYDNKWQAHRLTVNGVYSYQQYTFESMHQSGKGFPTDITGFNNIGLAETLDVPESDKYSSKLISWTARAAYAFKDKYLLTVTGRYDGSSRFGANNKWGFFPSVGIGWRIIEEGFMRSLPVFSNLKLRGSYGFTGNQEIGNYRSLAALENKYYIYNNERMLGLIEGLGNPNLKWERTRQIDAGLEIGLWKNCVELSVDYYRRNTTDLLYDVPIPTNSGFRSMLQNIGEVSNKGVEGTLNVQVINNKNLTWNIGGNVTRNINRVEKLYGDVTKVLLEEEQGLADYLIVGQPLNGVWARQSAGIIRTKEEAEAIKSVQPFAEPGGEKYVDQNGDGHINLDDYVLIGATEPKFFYGITTNVSYKRFRLDIYGQGASGLATTSTQYLLYGEYQIQNRNYIPSRYAYERMWREDNPGGAFPKPGAKEVYLSDRSNGHRKYFLLKNIRLGYDLQPDLFGSKWFKNINVYVNAQNYLSFTNFRGYNPENGDYSYPLAKALIFGLNATF